MVEGKILILEAQHTLKILRMLPYRLLKLFIGSCEVDGRYVGGVCLGL